MVVLVAGSSGRTGEARGGARRVSVGVGRAGCRSANVVTRGWRKRCPGSGNRKDERVAVALGKVERINSLECLVVELVI